MSVSDLVLELVEGGDLLEYILKHNGVRACLPRFVRCSPAKHFNIAEVDAKHIAYQICDALAVRGCFFYVTSSLLSFLFRASVYTLQGHHPSRFKA